MGKRYVKFVDYTISNISGAIIVKVESDMNVTGKMKFQFDMNEIKMDKIEGLIFSKLNSYCQTHDIEYEVYNRNYYELLRLCKSCNSKKDLISKCLIEKLDKTVIFDDEMMICKSQLNISK